ncbi:MAG TPA: hypothetical protein VJU77_12270 [Chthoniobacterales bacterium]|nr:hypothetical protein [Chthoniobacterales bacterium]
MKLRYLLTLIAIVLVLASCSSPEPTSTASRSSAAAETDHYASPPRDRPGLGTKWGETRDSRVTATTFLRASPQPLATAAIYYNNAAGIQAMAGAANARRQWPLLRAPAGNLVSVGLRDQSGSFLPGLVVGDRWFVVGEEGRRYSIVVRNRSDLRLEVVLSVDGLDVMDGRTASFRKRGYLIEPHRQLVVEGFRQSTDAVAAFRFGPVRESYANQKYGDTRNVGVIGIALFHERGTNPLIDRDAQRRLKADPFPGRFATPP